MRRSPKPLSTENRKERMEVLATVPLLIIDDLCIDYIKLECDSSKRLVRRSGIVMTASN